MRCVMNDVSVVRWRGPLGALRSRKRFACERAHPPPPVAQAGFVHRDLRWANVSRNEHEEYFLIDLEVAGRAGEAVQFNLREWDDNTLERAGGTGAKAAVCPGCATNRGCGNCLWRVSSFLYFFRRAPMLASPRLLFSCSRRFSSERQLSD